MSLDFYNLDSSENAKWTHNPTTPLHSNMDVAVDYRGPDWIFGDHLHRQDRRGEGGGRERWPEVTPSAQLGADSPRRPRLCPAEEAVGVVGEGAGSGQNLTGRVWPLDPTLWPGGNYAGLGWKYGVGRGHLEAGDPLFLRV